MEKVLKRYQLKFDEVEQLTLSLITRLPDTFEELQEKAEDMLIDAYLEGYSATGYMLNDDTERQPDTASILLALGLLIDGQSLYERLRTYYDSQDVEGVRGVLLNEWHRIYNEGSNDRAEEYGEGVYKVWVTVNDSKVRETHRYIEGIKIPADGEFFTIDGDHSPIPGRFGKPQNNINCRCVLRYTTDSE